MNCHRDRFDRFYRKMKLCDKHFKKGNHLAWDLICVLVAMKNDQLDF